MIARGKIGIWNGTGVKGWVYNISIPINVSLPYTCHQKKAQINQTDKTNNSEMVNQSIKLSNFSFLIFSNMAKTVKNHINAHAREKL